MTKNKDCNCGHSEKEHSLVLKEMRLKDFIINPSRIFVLKEYKGECTKCLCPKYKPLNFWDPEKRNYSLLSTTVDEKRCTRCGRLLVNHKNVAHPFQGEKIDDK